MTKPFASKVSERIAPGYSEVIKVPMDLGQVQSKLETPREYKSAEDVRKDIALVIPPYLH